jgi:protein SCO1/2
MLRRRDVPRVIAALVLASLASACSGRELPTLGDVPRFTLTDQGGAPFTNDTLRGKVWAAAFIFTRCPSACPLVTRAMRGVQLDAAKKSVPLRLVSFSIDPDNDTPPVLRQYAAQYGADLGSWSFVTGDSAGVKTTAEQGFKIAAEGVADPTKPDFGLSHGTQLVLVDPAEKIRGYYSTSDDHALADLVTDAARLSR